MPVRFLRNHDLLQGRILDFGCGYGYEVDELREEGFDITGYDKYLRTQLPQGKFDTILCTYVLNFLEPEEQKEVLMQVSNLLNPDGCAYITVRRDVEQEGFQLHPSGEGYIYNSDVTLPYESIKNNGFFEIYQYRHYNQIDRDNADCPFCNLHSDCEIISETDTCVSFFDAYPVSKGHALIIPKRHVASYFDLTDDELHAMNEMLKFVKSKIDEQYHPDGYNIGININEAAGQSVFHVHMHVIPRYTGDVEQPKGGVRAVIPGKQNYDVKEPSTDSKPKRHKSNKKAYTYEEKREEYGNAYLPWEEEADELLTKMYVEEGTSIALLSEIFERTKGAIHSRLVKLGLIKE